MITSETFTVNSMRMLKRLLLAMHLRISIETESIRLSNQAIPEQSLERGSRSKCARAIFFQVAWRFPSQSEVKR